MVSHTGNLVNQSKFEVNIPADAKRGKTCVNEFWFLFWLDDKLAQVFF